MTIDEVNALCAEIAAEEAEARMNEIIDALLDDEAEAYENMALQYQRYDDESGPWPWELQ